MKTLLLTIFLSLPFALCSERATRLAAYEHTTTDTEIQILDDDGNVVATYGPLTNQWIEPKPPILYRWRILTEEDWWSILQWKNGLAAEDFPHWAWSVLEHTLYLSPDEHYKIEEGTIHEVKIYQKTIELDIQLESEKIAWIDPFITRFILERGSGKVLSKSIPALIPEPEPIPDPKPVDIDISLVVNLRFDGKTGYTYELQRWVEDEWETFQTKKAAKIQESFQVERTADVELLRILELPQQR